MDKIELIKKAIADADQMQSGLPREVFDNVPALVSLKGRHLYNNLGKLATKYLEIGVHVAGSYCSVTNGNKNIDYAVAVDSFESDNNSERKCKDEFLANAGKYGILTKLIVSDAFKVDLSEIEGGIDMYTFDGTHSYEHQKEALLYYKSVLADTFIFVCDDWQYGDVKKGTIDGIKEANYEIVTDWELLNDPPYEESEHRNMEWWRGYYVALLRKKQ